MQRRDPDRGAGGDPPATDLGTHAGQPGDADRHLRAEDRPRQLDRRRGGARSTSQLEAHPRAARAAQEGRRGQPQGPRGAPRRNPTPNPRKQMVRPLAPPGKNAPRKAPAVLSVQAWRKAQTRKPSEGAAPPPAGKASNVIDLAGRRQRDPKRR